MVIVKLGTTKSVVKTSGTWKQVGLYDMWDIKSNLRAQDC